MIMVEIVTRLDMLFDRHYRPPQYKHDRKDIYRVAGYEDMEYDLSRRHYYLLIEAHENPDEDW